MRIASIETIIVDLPTRLPHHLAMAIINSQGRVLARIRDENGNEGICEAPVIPDYGAETVEGIKLLIDDYLGPSVIDQNPAAYTSTSIRVGLRPRQFGRLNGCRTLVSPCRSWPTRRWTP
jgi:hypothetical protein